MNGQPEKRLLAAILNADVAGYTKLMADDETATFTDLEQRRDIFRRHVEVRGGRVVDMTGDNILATFDSALEAVRASIAVQTDIEHCNDELSESRRMHFRIGVNLGDVVIREDGTVYGDGVNVASRLQSLSNPGEICLSASIYDLTSSALDVDVEDLGLKEIKNVNQPIHTYRIALRGGAAKQESTTEVLRARPRQRPSIAVLPFENVGGDQEEEYLAEGIAEDIITELSRLRSLLVIARNSSFAYKDKSASIRSIADALGARFVVHGSVRRGGHRARITVELIDAETDSQLWAERYDRDMDDMFAIQDEIAQKILSILPSRIEDAELRRSRTKPTENLAAYHCLLRAKFHHHKRTEEDNRQGLAMVGQALSLDPDYAEAYAWKACLMAQSLLRGYADDDPDKSLNDMMESLNTALSLDEDDFETHRVLSGVWLAQREYDRALFHAARAQDLNPNDPRVMSQYGETLTAHGKAEEAIVVLENALQVDPYRPDNRLTHLGAAQFVAHHYEDAIASFKRVSDLNYHHHVYLAACYAALGRQAEASKHGQEVYRLNPDFNWREYVHQLAYRDDADREHHRAAIIKAGLARDA